MPSLNYLLMFLFPNICYFTYYAYYARRINSNAKQCRTLVLMAYRTMFNDAQGPQKLYPMGFMELMDP